MPISPHPSRDKALWGLAGAAVVLATYLHITREPSPSELGWRLARAFRQRDARSIAKMFSDEELQAIGVSRAQAAQIVAEIVLPDADLYTDRLSRITISGQYLEFEKPKGDLRYFVPPNIHLTPGPNGERFLSLGDLLGSVWGYRRASFTLGFTTLDPRPGVRREFQRVKELGMTKSMDWSKHEVHDQPEEPFGF